MAELSPSPRAALVGAIEQMRKPATRGLKNPKENFLHNPKTIGPAGAVMDLLIAEQYAARHSGTGFATLKKKHPAALAGWEQIRHVKKDFGGSDSLDMALYRNGDATVAVILGVKPGVGELFTEGRYVLVGGAPPPRIAQPMKS